MNWAVVTGIFVAILSFIGAHSPLPQHASQSFAIEDALSPLAASPSNATTTSRSISSPATQATPSQRTGGLGVVIANEPQAATSLEWKTYTNAQYGFSLQYPATTSLSFVDHVLPRGDDLIVPCDGTQSASSSCFIFIDKDGSIGAGDLTFFVFQKAMSNLEIFARSSGRPNEFASKTIDGLNEYLVHFGPHPGGLNEVYAQNAAHLFLFYYPDSKEQIAAKILSTLRLN